MMLLLWMIKLCTIWTTVWAASEGGNDNGVCQYENCKSCGGYGTSEECYKCYDGYYLGENKDCISKCRQSCAKCTSYNNCSQCFEGIYGIACQNVCSVGCYDNTCSIDGHCNCTKDFIGDTCMDCIDGKFGPFCNQSCSKYCKENKCNRTTGFCIDGCTSVNISGESCDKSIAGTYGERCAMICPKNCRHKMCERDSGNCTQGCVSGNHGENCTLNCPMNCADGICEQTTGTCYGCIGNFQSETCTECLIGYHGPNCNDTCSPHCTNGNCNRNNGDCIFGCIIGYSGDKCCAMSEHCVECFTNTECKTCRSGFFMNSCNQSCPGDCLTSCDISTGKCEGQTYEQQDPAGPISWLVAITVGVTWIFITIILIRRRMRKHLLRSKSVDNTGNLSSDTSVEYVETVKDAQVSKKPIGGRVPDADLVDETNYNEIHYANDYCNRSTVNINVKVEDLFTYVTKDNVDIFEKEFENLPIPDDISESCKIANRPGNSELNRYDSIYPFDHSRVMIPGQTKFYINACYIDGYKRSKAYIASSGPTIQHTARFKTFWQMVWHEKSDIIVMLTKLREASVMKCEQYWPEIETKESYGHVKVNCRSIEEFAEYTVRSFTVSKGKEHRNLTQLHFTSWPDQEVPAEVTSLVEFRQRVKAAPVVLGGPVIVHCSAGIGRTGTYIALDILSEQGKTEHSVNIYNCVRKIRGQRVYMVQTVEQYIFLHKALVHTLLFGCESQTVEEIESLATDRNGTLMYIFQTLKHEIDFEEEDDLSAREENKTNQADESRRQSDIPGHRGRVHLHRNSGCHDYINAVFVSSFRIKDLFIAAQTPQSNTLEDFLCMIYQQNTFCVVAFEDPIKLSKKHDISIYIPANNGTYKCGDITVTSLKCENKPQYTITQLTVKHTDKEEEKTAYHFQYTKWGNGRRVPDSPADFVYFVKDVEKYVKQRKSYMTNVLVHCLNGYEKSGIFCVVYTLLEKLEAEGQVSAVNVIRKVRAQRKLSISSVEQLKFCYQCISACSKS